MNTRDFKEMHDKVVALEYQIEILQRKLQKAADLNYKMWLILQDQTQHTEQLERLSGLRKETEI